MIALVGLNHRSAPLDLRERAGVPDDEVPAALARLKTEGAIEEAVILSTCNRVEILARGAGGVDPSVGIRAFLTAHRGIDPETVERHAYVHAGPAAARHLFAVACGLDSMILGEPQILGQLKRAYELARGAGGTGPVLDHLVQQVLGAAKRVRAATGISRHAVSVAYAAATLARNLFDDLGGRSTLLIGAGKMTELAARHLVRQGVRDLRVTNRTYARAAALAEELGGVAIPWDSFREELARVDVVLTGTAAIEPVVGRDDVRRALLARRGRPLLIVDIAVPRDVEPSAHELEGVYLYDVDDLQDIVDDGWRERRTAADAARRLLEPEVAAFDRWRQSAELAPTIAALRERLHAIGRDETARHARRIAPQSAEQRAAIDELVRALVQKILHRPITELKAAADRGEAPRLAALYREIFGLAPDPGPAEPESDAGDDALGPRRLIRGGKDD